MLLFSPSHLRIIRNFKPDHVADATQDSAAQRSRERNAREVLLAPGASNATEVLNLYCKKTKVQLQEEFVPTGPEIECRLKYESILRSVQAAGSSGPFSRAAEGRKQAKRMAAAALLAALQQ